MKNFFKFLMCTLLCTLFASCHNNKTDNSTSSVDSDSVAQYVPTVQDLLNDRNDMIYQAKIDSIYLNMPEDIVISIVNGQSDGTYMTYNEIVEKYLANRASYDVLHDNIRLYKKYKTINIDSLLASKDSINKKNLIKQDIDKK